ncbi:MAG TPA: thioesterase family protein [Candidatus Saccharimonadales bacterium]|nr:thioesterase family protein [Candidatus Saccharimonadales bacterium]
MSAEPAAAPAPPRPAEPAVVRLPQAVHTFDVDFAGVVSNLRYPGWAELWREELARRCGVSLPDMLRAGSLPLLVRQELNFRRPLRFGESVSLEGWVERVGTSSFTLWMEVRDAATGELCADCRQVLVMTDLRSRRSVALPEELRRQLAQHA